MRSAAFCTLGCKVNQYETDAVEEKFIRAGFEIRPFTETADVYIINTCTVTNIADRKSRQMLHRAKKRNPHALIVALGCYAQVAESKLKEDAAVDLIVGTGDKDRIVELVKERLGCPDEPAPAHDAQSAVPADDAQSAAPAEEAQRGREFSLITASGRQERSRAFIKIQDGCNQFCSYCIIPYARGRVRSRSMEDIIREIRQVADAGYKEIVITGIHASSYGIDFDAAGRAEGEEDYGPFASDALISLIEEAARVPGIERIRLGSLEPRIITQPFLSRLRKIPQICPQFHLSLQSGCDATLRRMNRHYSTSLYLEKCAMIRDAFEDAAVTTDIIVGFPGETQEEFETTLDFVRKVKFADIHVFKYSRRSGTRAAAMTDQVSPQIQSVRSERLIKLAASLRSRYLDSLVGKPVQVLIEEKKEGKDGPAATGYSKSYVTCAFRGCSGGPGSIVKGSVLTRSGSDMLICEEAH